MWNFLFLKTFSLLFTSYLVTFYFAGCHGNKLILDISGIITTSNEQQNKGLASTVEWFHEKNPENTNPVLLYLGIGLDDYGCKQVENVLKVMKGLNFKVKLLINIRISYTTTGDERENAKGIHLKLLNLMNQESSLIAGLSHYPTSVRDRCRHNSTQPIVTNGNTSYIQKVEDFLKHWSTVNTTNGLFEAGYFVDSDTIPCKRHSLYKQDADYLIINFPLQRNDKTFVESYGAFKETMETQVSSIRDDLQRLGKFKTVIYLRISVTGELDVDHAEIRRCGKIPLNDKYLAKDALEMLENAEKGFTKRYEALLTQFCREWVANKSAVPVIITYHKDWHSALNYDNINWTNKQGNDSLVIPQITSLPLNGSNKNLMISTSKLLEEVAYSGFDTVMINGDTWQTLARSGIPKPNCTRSPCRPHNIWYLNNMHNPFSKFTYKEIQELLEVGGMRLSLLVFSSYYDEDRMVSWENVVNSLKSSTETSTSSSSLLNTACTNWPDFFGVIQNKIDIILAALEIRKVPACHSLHVSSKMVVWRGEFKLKKYDWSSYVDTMKKLDALVIARQMLHIWHPEKQVILRIKVVYEGKGDILIRYPVYCTKLAESVSQFYEILLNWANSHDFPIILEPIADGKGYNNPIAWNKLQSLTPGRMQNLMTSFPIFIRRSYNQSTVFGTWTQGMYPCIQQAQGNAKLEEVTFNHNFAGVTLRMDLRHDGTPLSTDELQTLVLFAVKKFTMVEIAFVSQNQLKNFHETITQRDFEVNLKLNQVEKRQMYLNVKYDVNAELIVNDIVSKLQSQGFQVHLHFYYLQEQSVKMPQHDQLAIGLIDDDCVSTANNILSDENNSKVNISQFHYLICNTSFAVASNQDKGAMQDYLESHLYLKKLFQHFFPNIKEIHFRLHSTLLGGSAHEESRNLHLFLADVNKFAQSYGIHYFLAPVISPESVSKTESSFWTVANYKNLADLSTFHERQATILNQSTWKPTIIKGNQTESGNFDNTTAALPTSPLTNAIMTAQPILIGNSSSTAALSHQRSWFTPEMSYFLVAITAFVVAMSFIKQRKNRRYLTLKEVKDFFNGRRETLEEAAHRRKRNTINAFNVFDGLVYQKDFEIFKKNIQIIRNNVIRNGKFSKEYRAKMKSSEVDCIVEVFCQRTSKDRFLSVLSELKMLCYVGNHVNIVRFIGCYTREIRQGGLWIVKEYCGGGSLIEYLQTCNQGKKRIGVYEMIWFAKEIANGMKYLSNQNVIHGDLRAKHVYLDQHKMCKVGNFGLYRKLPEYKMLVNRGNRELMPWRWMAPETLQNFEFSSQSDVWSYGVTIWEIFSLGAVPYETATIANVQDFIEELKNGKRPPIPTHAESVIDVIMQRCWALEPQNRPSFEELVNFFVEMRPLDVITTHL